MNIIVIDDEPAPLLTFASHILDNAAVTANMFSLKVDEALEFARTHEHKAVFLDIKMPSINGVELAEKFIEINPDVRIIFITGYAQNIREIKRQKPVRVLLQALRRRNAELDTDAACGRGKPQRKLPHVSALRLLLGFGAGGLR